MSVGRGRLKCLASFYSRLRLHFLILLLVPSSLFISHHKVNSFLKKISTKFHKNRFSDLLVKALQIDRRILRDNFCIYNIGRLVGSRDFLQFLVKCIAVKVKHNNVFYLRSCQRENCRGKYLNNRWHCFGTKYFQLGGWLDRWLSL